MKLFAPDERNSHIFQRVLERTLKDKYMDFTGRASRSEYWYFVLFYTIASTALMVLAFSGYISQLVTVEPGWQALVPDYTIFSQLIIAAIL